MDRIIMIEKRDGFKHIVGAGRYPADSIEFDEQGDRYVVKTGNKTVVVNSEVVVAVEHEQVSNQSKLYPSDF
jgi:hypothetical protein